MSVVGLSVNCKWVRTSDSLRNANMPPTRYAFPPLTINRTCWLCSAMAEPLFPPPTNFLASPPPRLFLLLPIPGLPLTASSLRLHLRCRCAWLYCFNPLKPELNPICYLLALLAHHFLHVSRIGVKSLTLSSLTLYIYGAPILDVSRSHTTTQHSR